MLNHVVTDAVLANLMVLATASLAAPRSRAVAALAPIVVWRQPPVALVAARLLTSQGESQEDRETSAERQDAREGAGKDGDSPRLQVLKERVAVLARLIGDSQTPGRRPSVG